VQDGNDANLSAKALRVCRYFQQGGGNGGKQQIVKAAWVLEREHVQFMWNAEDDMEVCRRQDFPLARSQPTLARLCLTLRAMPVTAGVVRDGLITAARARVEITSQSCCAAVLDGTKHFQLLKLKLN
jgi:hypothetical protein